MSPRAAARLGALAFAHVYDYVAGKADWGSAALPLEGAADSATRALAHVRADVPRCRASERLQLVRQRLGQWDTCFVVDDDGLVLGRLGRRALASDEDVSVDEVMTEGPSTVRPSARLCDLAERMRRQNLSSLPVTTSDGRLLGLLLRADAEVAGV
jgi:Mg/Co/Ni transporter MgtE